MHAIEAAALEAHWKGGASPFGASWQKTMMWVFIVTDALLFSGFLSGYAFLRQASRAPWPEQSEVFPLPFIALMTFVLITSSVFMATAVKAVQLGERRRALHNLVFTVLGGLSFLACQAYEWTHLIREGARLGSNPWGPPQFAQCFFVLTGFHGSHVLSGVVILGVTALRLARGKARAQGVEVAGLYWHFVDLVWVFIFTLFYLL